MSRYIGPKTKLSRKFGEDLSLKTNAAKTARRIMQAPGQHGAKMRRKISQYGMQLKEKQKVKAIYGVTERAMVRLYKEAASKETNTGMTLLSYLERRLDNVIYRSGLAPTRPAARQLVNHAHFFVNGKRMDVPSYRVGIDDVISVKPSSSGNKVLSDAIKNNETASPEWLQVKAGIIKVAKLPMREDTRENIEEQLIVEFYSR